LRPVTGSIDQQIQSKLIKNGLALSALADARTIKRRLRFDLTGLPPDAEDERLTVEPVLERLLNSPRFGERCRP
jgi:Protein of unknown function (DUF1549)